MNFSQSRCLAILEPRTDNWGSPVNLPSARTPRYIHGPAGRFDFLLTHLQRPKIQECLDRGAPYWFFRYWEDRPLPNGGVKTTRKRHILAPSKGRYALSRRQAETARDRFLAGLQAPPQPPVAPAGGVSQPTPAIHLSFGQLAEVWRRDFVEGQGGGRALVAASTRAKYIRHLENHVLPRWRDTLVHEFRAKPVLDWLQQEGQSWYMMADLRNLMSGIFTKAQEWELLPDSFANPMHRVRLPRKWEVREKRILSPEQAMRVLARLRDPVLLIGQTCLETGARISEVTGLRIRHVDLQLGCVRIEQRHWRGDIDEPKTARSRRTLALGSLRERYRRWMAGLEEGSGEGWVFPQQRDGTRPMWDSGVRKALKLAAAEEGCDFAGLGLHTLRRANITWRQEVGGSSIEASQIAGHANSKMTGEYTVVQLQRQEELTRRLQEKLAQAGKRRVRSQK
jgi:integrase